MPVKPDKQDYEAIEKKEYGPLPPNATEEEMARKSESERPK
jgi:hypothetical protein